MQQKMIIFGKSVALSADANLLVVGARGWESATSKKNGGGVYIYVRSGDSWVQRGEVLIGTPQRKSEWFGFSSALTGNGDTLIVGATRWNQGSGGSSLPGGVFVFDWDQPSQNWQREEVLTKYTFPGIWLQCSHCL